VDGSESVGAILVSQAASLSPACIGRLRDSLLLALDASDSGLGGGDMTPLSCNGMARPESNG
jgi:hypothetical protein